MIAELTPFGWVLIGFGWVLVFWAAMGVIVWTVDRWPRRPSADDLLRKDIADSVKRMEKKP